MDAGPPLRSGRRALATVSVGAAVLVVVWHIGGLGDLGITWDEPIYMRASARIQAWVAQVVSGPDRLAALGAGRIDEVFDWMHYWNPHPPVFREAMAATEALLAGWLGSTAAYRAASLAWFALLVGVVAYVAGRRWGLLAGAAAGLALALTPRVVGHAHIAATDMPLTSLWVTGSLGAFLYAEGEGRRWGAVAAVCFGLAMSTKFTGYLFPVPLLAWLLWRRPPLGRVGGAVAVGAAALVVAWAANPMAWHEPIGYVVGLFEESLARDEIVPISTYYLGTNYGYEVPWHHVFVMTVVTLPLPILALSGMGTADGLGRGDRLTLFCLAEIGFFLLLLAVPSSPNHDGVRLFLPLFPFVALLAGRGFSVAARRLRGGTSRKGALLAVVVLGAVFFYPPYLQTTRSDPYFLSYYGELVGGARGADERGMEATYWYDALTPPFLSELNRILPEDARVLTLPQRSHFQALQNFGRLREDLVITDDPGAPYVLLYARKSLMSPLGWRLYREVTPVRGVTYDGVELAGLYVADREARNALREEP